MGYEIVLRVDGGPKIGYGHLVRSSALAEELLTAGHTVTVATTTPEPAGTIFPEAINIIELPTRDDPEPFVDWLKTAAPDAAFIDAYPVDTAYQQAVRDRVRLAVLQDDTRHTICADIFINGNLYATDLNHEFVGLPPEICLGPEYVLLRQEIREQVAKDPPWREQPKRAIVTMGGSDINGLTPTVVRAFDGFELRVDAIVGPGCSEELEGDVRRVAANSSADVFVSRNPNNFVYLMSQADIAVSTASTTIYELLALGTPIVSIPVVNNQEKNAAALRAGDTATVLQPDASEETFRSAITEYIKYTELRRKRQIQGQKLVDGRGSERIAETVLRKIESK